jgi:hypothetical protein
MNTAEDRLKVGDLVMWGAVWGTQPAKLARVIGIEKTAFEHEKCGEAVQSVPWAEVACSIMSLDNGCWCYGDQVSKFDGPEPSDYAPQCPEPIRGRRKISLGERLRIFIPR